VSRKPNKAAEPIAFMAFHPGFVYCGTLPCGNRKEIRN
jgi:hypothetical protein